MKMSPFFSDLTSSYGYEIEDLTYDSAGANVLASRLKVKRDEFAGLLPMSASAPEMVAPAFRGAFSFGDKEVLERLVSAQPEDFPAWESVAETLELEPWAGKLVQQALASPDGERLMLVAAGLEYLFGAPAAAVETESAAGQKGDGEDDEESDDDLGEAGEDYLSEQGFDRRS
jgi:hypothetical protein